MLEKGRIGVRLRPRPGSSVYLAFESFDDLRPLKFGHSAEDGQDELALWNIFVVNAVGKLWTSVLTLNFFT